MLLRGQIVCFFSAALARAAVDRASVVARHNLALSAVNASNVLSVGNGDAAVNLDITGTQTFNSTYSAVYDLNTLSSWAFHNCPFSQCGGPADAAAGEALTSFNFSLWSTPTNANGNIRQVPYPSGTGNGTNGAVNNWLHSNPHRLNLVQVSLRALAAQPGSQSTQPLSLQQISATSQQLNLWTGVVGSNFTYTPSGSSGSSAQVAVTTAFHPNADLLSLRIAPQGSGDSIPLPLGVRLAFPYATGGWGPSASDWASAHDGWHTTTALRNTSANGVGSATFLRQLDSDSYRVDCSWAPGGAAGWVLVRAGPHAFDLVPSTSAASAPTLLDVSCLFAPLPADGDPLSNAIPLYPVGAWMPWLQQKAGITAALQQAVAQGAGLPLSSNVTAASAAGWADYWNSGGFVDIAGRTADASAWELERRVVLSQYQLRVHDAGASPPQETGLLCNSWSGKHHSEMRYWHQAHWAVWGKLDLLHRSDGFYVDYLPNATSMAAFQGYDGCRWPKMAATLSNHSLNNPMNVFWPGMDYHPFPFNGGNTSGYGKLQLWESASDVGPMLVWEQPHVILLAELARQTANATGGPTLAQEILEFHAPLVQATAEFEASFLFFNSTSGYMQLGPPVKGGEEEGQPNLIYNPTFELVYFSQTLDIANVWRELQGLPRNSTWDSIVLRMPPLPLDPAEPASTPLYTLNAACACEYLPPGSPKCPKGQFGMTQCAPLQSHPMTAGLVGMLNGLAVRGSVVNITTANNTLARIITDWEWGSANASANVWGWDAPLVGLSQARLVWDGHATVAMLLLPVIKNYYTEVGLNYQTSQLPAYMPGNGGLLLAVGSMAAGMGLCNNNSGSGGGVGLTLQPGVAFPAEWGVQYDGFPACGYV